MHRRTRTSALLSSVALLLVGQPLVAQDPATPGKDEPKRAGESSQEDGEPILVTGSRIRGAKAIAETTTIDREAIIDAGQVDLGEAIRSLPQNFSGGQNPGVGSGAGIANENVNSASSPNLRGLGTDATLTLLNGHRLPYDSASQGADISAIPLAAIERVEVLPDGASALYGSDAVAGVVNVILRRDFEGVTTSAQLGAATDGGYFRQQADIVGGTRWSGGGVMLAYAYAHNSDIAAGQRDYAASLDPASTLYPRLRHHAATLSAHHALATGIEVGVDALYSQRDTLRVTSSPGYRIDFDPSVETYMVAPSVKVDAGGGWEARLNGAAGRDRTRLSSLVTRPTGTSATSGCYCASLLSIEGGIEGPLFALPGGSARLAAGTGYRANRLDYSLVTNGSPYAAFDRTRRSHFAYGELYLPFVSAANAVPGVRELVVSAALRHEDYPGLDKQTTPRVGLVYAPLAGLTLRGSWSRSFKAPTLYQQYVPYQTYLLPAAPYGAGSASQTVLAAFGGQPDVRSERARSWTAGFEARPLPGLTASATWFDIRYTDRLVQPIVGPLSVALQNPGYASLIDRSPDANVLADLIAGSQFGLQNLSGQSYNPANVAAYIDNRYLNVAAQAIRGVDGRIAWNKSLGNGRSVDLDLSGTWLKSSQQITSALPDVQLAGVVFGPPRLRGRATATYTSGALGITAAASYIGALVDRRFADEARIAPGAFLDLGIRYDVLGADRREPGLALSLTMQNLLDRRPQTIGKVGPTDTPYDSTNYSPIGRFIAFGIRRHW